MSPNEAVALLRRSCHFWNEQQAVDALENTIIALYARLYNALEAAHDVREAADECRELPEWDVLFKALHSVP